MTDPRLNRARTPLYLYDEDGVEREYQGRPLSDGDMDELNCWLRSEFIRRAEQSLSGISDESLRYRILQGSVREAVKIDFMDGSIGTEMVGGIDGLSRLLWQSLREDQPKLTHEGVKRMLMRDENTKRGERFWTRLNLGEDDEDEGEDEPAEKPAKKRRRRKPKSTKRSR